MAEAAGPAQRRTGRVGRRIAGLAVLVALAACNTVVPRAPIDRSPPPPARGPRLPPPSPGVDTGVVQDAERHRVALLVPLTGRNAALGQSLANATQLALLDTGNAQVRITTYDTGAGAGAAVSHALADGAQLILGPLLAEDVRAVVPAARAAHVPVVSFSNDASVAGPGSYLLGYAPAQSVDRVVGFARTHGVASFGALVPNALYGQRTSTAFLRAVEADGGKVIAMQTFDRATGGIAAASATLVKKGPYDAVLVADSGANAAVAGPVLKRGGTPLHLLGTELWNSEATLASRPALNGAWFASVSDTLYRQYRTKYRARFGADPYRLSSLGYDSVLLVVRIARDWPVGAAFPEGRLRDRGGFSGIDGAFRFGRDGVAERALEVHEVRGGKVATVSPAPLGFEDR
ncbi:penicillin-binding protein activator [uncultured Sphingomonas sp.]|uniref:penicillin-binding protein activator n=1 Tax=uncultured Sphingomonas sp. TaxID=158754 RepID=UPI0035C98777